MSAGEARDAAPDAWVVDRLRAAGCVFAEDEAALLTAAAVGDELEVLVTRRVAGEPLEHLLGWVAFAGRRWSVGPGVFVPRRRTELMVRTAVALPGAGAVLVDLCCGCGAVGGAVLLGLADDGRAGASLHAADVEPAAVAHARANLAPLGGVVHAGDLFDALPADLRGRIDVLTCNAPYVPTGAIGTMPPEAREHEPAVALDGGGDGLDVLRRVVAAAPAWLAPGGSLLFEVGAGQVDAARALVAAHRMAPRVVRDDDPWDDEATGGIVLVATRPGG